MDFPLYDKIYIYLHVDKTPLYYQQKLTLKATTSLFLFYSIIYAQNVSCLNKGRVQALRVLELFIYQDYSESREFLYSK